MNKVIFFFLSVIFSHLSSFEYFQNLNFFSLQFLIQRFIFLNLNKEVLSNGRKYDKICCSHTYHYHNVYIWLFVRIYKGSMA